MNRVLVRCYSKSVPVLENLDPLQEASLEERCITVNEKDHAIGNATKRECHQVGKNGQLILHRAFSVFIFNSKGDLLLQRRSPQKITFPDCYTNACCSHPLYDLEAEREERDASGVRKAAQRRLQHELGIPPQEATPESFHYLTRIHYQAGNRGQWGEHEIDYIMILHRDVTLKPNMNEVSEVRMRWYGHVMRMEKERIPRRIMEMKYLGKRPQGRPCKRWEEQVTVSVQVRQEEWWKDKDEEGLYKTDLAT
uniref:isopentenyl-diphosphate Delta-isomerase n=1 Tax=Timema bartmani TaxID=61472 RepID=A0A7R9F0N6_9NEOP|nr:unnamed protein product [Timema bartmani]